MPEFPDAVCDLLARQDRVVTRAQLLERGVTYPAVRWGGGYGAVVAAATTTSAR